MKNVLGEFWIDYGFSKSYNGVIRVKGRIN